MGVPIELAHLGYRNSRTYENDVGFRGLRWYGKKAWRRYVEKVVAAWCSAAAMLRGTTHMPFSEDFAYGRRPEG